MHKLHGRPGTGSVAVEAVLELAGAAYVVEPVARGADGSAPAGLRALNPMGQVPVLVLPDGTVMTESCAMMLHLADAFPMTGLAPRIDEPERPVYLRWMVFLAANIYASDLRVYYPQRYTTDLGGAAAVKTAALERMAFEWQVFADALGAGPYVLGERLSAIDLYAAMLATWNLDVPGFFAKHPNVKVMHDRVTSVPAIGKVWVRNTMDG